MDTLDNFALKAPLTPEEIDWVSELVEKLPEDIDLTFEESKILTRLPIREWPDMLLLKVKDVIDVEDFLTDGSGEGLRPDDHPPA